MDMPKTEKTDSAIDAVESFLSSKGKKKSPSKSDCAEFSELWGQAVRDEGLSKAMPLLCRGFSFSAAEPLYDYVKETGCSSKEYPLIGSYPSVRDSKNEIELRIYLSLLSYELMEPTSTEAIPLLLKRVATTSFNKEGKPSGNLSTYVRKLLVRPLAGKRIAVNSDFATNPKTAKAFSRVVEPHLRTLTEGGSCSPKEAQAAKDVIAWCESLIEPEAKAECHKERRLLDHPKSAPASLDEPLSDCQDMSEADRAIAFIKRQQAKIDSAKSSIATLESDNARLQNERKKLNEQVAELKNKLDNSREHCRKLTADLSCEKDAVKKLEADLASAKEYAEVVAKSTTKENVEANKRIARKLKIEYQDFQDAEGMEMDADLGENMRLQLQSVFKILKDNGFDL